VRLRVDLHLSYGAPVGRRDLPAGKHGAIALPIGPNFWTEMVARTMPRRKSGKYSARRMGSTLRNGTSRRNRNGCASAQMNDGRPASIDRTQFSIRGSPRSLLDFSENEMFKDFNTWWLVRQQLSIPIRLYPVSFGLVVTRRCAHW